MNEITTKSVNKQKLSDALAFLRNKAKPNIDFRKSITRSDVFKLLEDFFNNAFLRIVIMTEQNEVNKIDTLKSESTFQESESGEFAMHKKIIHIIYNVTLSESMILSDKKAAALIEIYLEKPREFASLYANEIDIYITYIHFLGMINQSQFAYYLLYYLHNQANFLRFAEICDALDVAEYLSPEKKAAVNIFTERTIGIYKAAIASLVMNDANLAHINKCIANQKRVV